MSDTIACSNCGTEVPSAAAFCTGCGQPLQAAAATPAPPPPPPPPTDDATRVETPGLNDPTQVTPPPPSAPAPLPYAPPPPAPRPPGAPGAPTGPWGPSSSPPPTGAPTSAPWNPPASPPPPSWQQPTAPPPGAATFAPPLAPAGSPPTWGEANAAAGPPAWGQAQPAPPAAKSSPSILGGLVGLIGAVLTIVGVFSGWVKVGNTGTVTAWSLTVGDGVLKTQTPYAIVALGGLAGITALLLFTGFARTPVRIVAALTGIAIVGTTTANWAEIASYVTDNFPSSFEVTTAIGFYLAIVGGVFVFVSALLPAKKKG